MKDMLTYLSNAKGRSSKRKRRWEATFASLENHDFNPEWNQDMKAKAIFVKALSVPNGVIIFQAICAKEAKIFVSVTTN